MTIGEHYKLHSRKSIKPYAKLLVFVVLVIVIQQTFARFSDAFNISSTIQVANWSILINNNQITNSTNNIQNSVNIISSSTGQNILKPGETGYFDIEINPANTQVSIEYTITIDISSLPSGTTLTSCELYEGTSLTNPVQVNLLTNQSGNKYVQGNIQIGANGNALAISDKKTYRVYCTLDSNLTSNSGDTYYVVVNVEGRQIII